MKILVIQQKMIGDVLVSSILCENLRIEFPKAQIDYLIYDTTKPVLDGANYIDNILLFTQKERTNKIELVKFILKIRKKKYDIIIDPYSKLESWLIVFFSGAKKTISFEKKGRNFLYTNVVKRKEDYPSNLGLIIEQRLSLLKELNIEPKITFPSLHVNDFEREFAAKVFELNGISNANKTIMVSILGSDKNKTYPLNYMAEIVDYIADNYEVSLVFNYIPNQIRDARKVYELCKKTTQEKIYFDVIGASIREFIALMNNCVCIIGNDGGAINMAKALNKPSFVIFSPVIDKRGWALKDDGVINVSFHLKDFKPGLFNDKTIKTIKKQNLELYKEFEPKLLLDALKAFLANQIS